MQIMIKKIVKGCLLGFFAIGCAGPFQKIRLVHGTRSDQQAVYIKEALEERVEPVLYGKVDSSQKNLINDARELQKLAALRFAKLQIEDSLALIEEAHNKLKNHARTVEGLELWKQVQLDGAVYSLALENREDASAMLEMAFSLGFRPRAGGGRFPPEVDQFVAKEWSEYQAKGSSVRTGLPKFQRLVLWLEGGEVPRPPKEEFSDLSEDRPLLMLRNDLEKPASTQLLWLPKPQGKFSQRECPVGVLSQKCLAETSRGWISEYDNEHAPLFSKWWVWAIGGVLVAGAAAMTAYALWPNPEGVDVVLVSP